jgi:hypothetical protein
MIYAVFELQNPHACSLQRNKITLLLLLLTSIIKEESTISGLARLRKRYEITVHITIHETKNFTFSFQLHPMQT